MAEDTRIIRGESWRKLADSLDEKLQLMQNHAYGVQESEHRSDAEELAEQMFQMYFKLAEEVKRVSCFEPGLRYWQLGTTVWASTLDEGALRNIPEISYEDFQKLRKAEWANVTEASLL